MSGRKCGPRSPDTQAIFMFIRAHQPVAQAQLLEHFQPQAAAAGVTVEEWLRRKVVGMTGAGFIHHGPNGWESNPNVECAKTRVTWRQKGEKRGRSKDHDAIPDFSDPNVAQPRRVDMFGPAYVPPAIAYREGSQDHARHPSLINGVGRPYRGHV